MLKWIGERFTERHEHAVKFANKYPLTPYARDLWLCQKALVMTTKYEFTQAGAGKFYVKTITSGSTREVTASTDGTYRCTCAFNVEFRLPCRHVMVALKNRNISPLAPTNMRVSLFNKMP